MAAELLTPESLVEMESLQLRARTLVESVLTGTHRGNQRGFSVDFAEHRDYSPGDDVRFLDWKLYARRDRFYVRQFEDENQLQAWMLLDVSGSMRYQSGQSAMSKLEYAACLAAAIGWIACYQQDQAALLSFDGNTESVAGSFRGMAGASELIERLQTIIDKDAGSPSHDVSDDEAWSSLQTSVERIPERSIVFLLSDAFGELVPLKRALTLLRRKECDVRLVHVLDSAELNFPFEGSMLFQDLEGAGESRVMAKSIRSGYLKEFGQFLNDVRKIAGETNCQYMQVETSQTVDRVLREILHTGQPV